jgi:hypothetical protein
MLCYANVMQRYACTISSSLCKKNKSARLAHTRTSATRQDKTKGANQTTLEIKQTNTDKEDLNTNPLIAIPRRLRRPAIDPARHRKRSRIRHTDEAKDAEQDVEGAGARGAGHGFVV